MREHAPPADETFKLAQALRLNTEEMWDRTGVLEKQFLQGLLNQRDSTEEAMQQGELF